MAKETKLYFYEVDKDYADYLRKYEPKIPNIGYSTHNKFLCGVVLEINNCKYFVPVSSLTKVMLTSLPIYANSKLVATLRFSFMFPIPEGKYSIKRFDLEEIKYKRLLEKEIKYCNLNRETIRKKALDIYNKVVDKKVPLMVFNCCDFSLLEEKCKEYIAEREPIEAELSENEVKKTEKELSGLEEQSEAAEKPAGEPAEKASLEESKSEEQSESVEKPADEPVEKASLEESKSEEQDEAAEKTADKPVKEVPLQASKEESKLEKEDSKEQLSVFEQLKDATQEADIHNKNLVRGIQPLGKDEKNIGK